MNSITSLPIPLVFKENEIRHTYLNNFLDWCGNQRQNNLFWLAISLTLHGCLITPFTIGIILFSGSSLVLFILAFCSMCMVLVTNLAALPTRITIPFFFFSILLDLMIIVLSISLYHNSLY